MFAPSGSGTPQATIKINAYGQGSRPRIDAGGKSPACLLLKNVAYWEVTGLEITNTDGTDADQGNLFGIYVLVQGMEGVWRHIYVDDCYVHDVNGLVAGKKRGGIHVHVQDCEATRLDDLRITNNRIIRIGGVGIGNTSSCGRVEFRESDTLPHYLWTNAALNFGQQTGSNKR
jgi:hypothetical protein